MASFLTTLSREFLHQESRRSYYLPSARSNWKLYLIIATVSDKRYREGYNGAYGVGEATEGLVY